VVVGVDGSPSSQLVLDFAFAYAARRQLPLVAVHSWRELSAHSAHLVLTEAANRQDLADSEERVLAEALAGWSERYPEVPVRHIIRWDRPVNALLSFSPRAELLVVGSRGHGGFVGMLLGSTSESLVRYASGPVAVVHPGLGVDELESERGSAQVGN
jgi:nucleotide-binding universal stress UspA family protein